MKIIITIILLTGYLIADISNPKEAFTSLCIEEGSTGFNWKNKKWVQANFRNEKFIIKKVFRDSRRCPSSKQTIDKSKNFQILKGCYVLNNFGQDYDSERPCSEIWTKNKDGIYILDKVHCRADDYALNSFYFYPSGNFIHSTFTFSLGTDEEKQKDSMVVSHGKCSKI